MEPTTAFQINDIASAIMGLFILLAAISGLVLKYKGLLTLGKPVERRQCVKNCADHAGMEKDVALVTQDVDTLKDRQGEVLKKITTIDSRVGTIDHSLAELVGYLRGKSNGSGI